MRLAIATSADVAGLPRDERLSLPALAASGFDALPTVWNDPGVDWSRFDAVVVRTTWDYHRSPAAFAAWLEAREAAGQPVANDPASIRWNADKRYLLDLAAAGVETVPTRLVERAGADSLEALQRALGTAALVVKPTIDASGDGAWRTDQLTAAEAAARFASDSARHALLVQPLVEAIFAAGELSLVFFAGRFSHAVRKRAAAGEFRIHEERGGRSEPAEIDPALVRWAAGVVAAVPGDTVFCRVDLVESAHGPQLMEVEVIEPELFFRFTEAGPARYARALADRLGP